MGGKTLLRTRPGEIRRRRYNKGLRIQQLAMLAGLSWHRLYKLEQGAPISAKNARAIARELECGISDITTNIADAEEGAA